MLAVTDIGPPRNTATVFLHGFLGSGRDWMAYVDPASETRYLLLDLPGHGKSPVFGTDVADGFAAFRQAFIALLDDLTLERIHLIGYSMGGRLALDVAAHHDDRIAQLDLISTHPGLEDEESRKKRHHWESDLLHHMTGQHWPTFLRDWYRQPIFSTLAQQPNYQAMLRDRMLASPATVATAFQDFRLSVQASHWDYLARSERPIRYIYGDADLRYADLAREIQDRAVKVVCKGFAACSHAVHIEAVDAMKSYLFQRDVSAR